MARSSTNENKNAFWQARESLGLSREAASELLERMPPERIARIETEKFSPHPDEVLLMSEKYKDPTLCNYYCSQQCSIGRQYVPEIKMKDLSQIVLEMLASLNSMQRQTTRLIDIAADGVIDDEELKDFVQIQRELERISITVETLQLWSEQMLATGKINMQQYNDLVNK